MNVKIFRWQHIFDHRNGRTAAPLEHQKKHRTLFHEQKQEARLMVSTQCKCVAGIASFIHLQSFHSMYRGDRENAQFYHEYGYHTVESTRRGGRRCAKGGPSLNCPISITDVRPKEHQLEIQWDWCWVLLPWQHARITTPSQTTHPTAVPSRTLLVWNTSRTTDLQTQ